MSGFNTIPPNPFPPSTDEDGTQAEQIKHLQEDVSTLQEDVSTLQEDVSTLQEDVSTLQGNVSTLSTTKANQAAIAPSFSEETSYSIGDIVYYEGAAYRCTNAHEGAWDDDDFAVTTVALELDSLKSGLTNLNSKIAMSGVAKDIGIWTNDSFAMISIHGVTKSFNITIQADGTLVGSVDDI